MKQLVIEKGIPLPPKRNRGCGRSAGLFEALRAMEPGDSVLSPYEENTTRSSAVVIGRETGARFTVRRDGMSFRIWRIA